MIYQETYQIGGDPAKLNISSITYTKDFPRLTQESIDAASSSSEDFPAHCHSFYEIIYTEQNTIPQEADTDTVKSPPHGTLSFCPPLSLHQTLLVPYRYRLILQFSPRLIQSFFSRLNEDQMLVPAGDLLQNGSVPIPAASPLHPLMQELLRLSPHIHLPEEEDRKIYSFPDRTNLALSAVLACLLAALMEEGYLTLSVSDLNISNLVKMQALLNRLISAPEEKLPMEEAASMLNMSYSNFCRTFKRTFGNSYVDFCNTIRIKRAQELLCHTAMSVTEVSAHLNFGSISYFNRIFKKHTGCTPLNYRAAR